MIMLTNEIMTLTDKKYQFSFESRTILKIIVLGIVLFLDSIIIIRIKKPYNKRESIALSFILLFTPAVIVNLEQ